MVHNTEKSALQAAINIIEAQGLVSIKIIFDKGEEASFYLDVLRWLPYKYGNDWTWQQNGVVIGFIIDKMTTEWESLLTELLTESGRYVVHSWHVA